ncbi:MAG TPA: exodeoxyribonuclease VII large subunit [Thermosulfurimonas dismutans]|uniref:Exodeoxyribonuclease 7 large subunit n=1 Tax=Thermosulfurimonas dismutans TaxID=999894 RepID=A0A7C3CP30_9BACT|nr:exodeoxyribonuclease VII large subunit [Thermosulfurimonas dismutans]
MSVFKFSTPRPRGAERLVFTVSELTGRIKDLLETHLLTVWVEGEIYQLKNHDSGHVFFSLKDERALLRVILFRDRAREVSFPLREGMKVLCFGRISVYEPRGEYRLLAQRIEPRGAGALQAAFEALKEELRRQGYFDPSRKKPLPSFPQRVGVITSLSGAALHDFLRVALSRWPAYILIYPVRVQGEGAAEEIARAVEELNRMGNLDLILITRGGGSLEDLQAFNHRLVAEAVFRSRLPVVSAVGHEIDYTICDFVADHRAPTPTAAASLIFPEEKTLLADLRLRLQKLREEMERRLVFWERELHHLRRRLKSPETLLGEKEARLHHLVEQITQNLKNLLHRREERFLSLVRHLEAVSPLAVLSRGYSVVKKLPQGNIVRRAEETRPGDLLEILPARGRILARVEEVSRDAP